MRRDADRPRPGGLSPHAARHPRHRPGLSGRRSRPPAAPRPAMLIEESLPDHFRVFAAVVERDGGTTYGAICRRVAGEPEVLSLLSVAPPSQRRPLLLLAAVHS